MFTVVLARRGWDTRTAVNRNITYEIRGACIIGGNARRRSMIDRSRHGNQSMTAWSLLLADRRAESC